MPEQQSEQGEMDMTPLTREAAELIPGLIDGTKTLAEVRNTIYSLHQEDIISNSQADRLIADAKKEAFVSLQKEIMNTKDIQAMRRELDLAEEYRYITAEQKHTLVKSIQPEVLQRVDMTHIRPTLIETMRNLGSIKTQQ